MINTLEPLRPGCIYHVYNRANGSEQLFLSDENKRYFLEKYKQHISPIADTFCYCLMSNHFHLLIRIKDEEYLRPIYPKLDSLDRLNLTLSKTFSNFFSGYTQAFNKQQNRMGSLFMKNFKRKLINEQSYLRSVVRYIHQNPVDANLCDSPEKWAHSSYAAIISSTESWILRQEVIGWFDGIENFEFAHKQRINSSPFNE